MNKLLSTYGLTRAPFSKDIPAAELLRTEAFEAALEALKAAIEGQTSALVTGDSGSGKTALIRVLEEELPQGRYRFHYTANSSVNRRDFYRQLSVGLGLEPHSSFAALYTRLNQHIQDLATQHKLRFILVVDEGHLLPIQVLEQLHVLMNFVRDSKPWLSLILVGLPDLRETLKRNVLTSLASRIPIRIQVPPWDAETVKVYVRHRMTSAGCRREVFSDDALLLMAKATGGLLRKIDILGDHCLTIALKSKSGLIDAAIVQQGIRACGDALL
jgi:type II secretory pathway predicted ATPase ExeA